MKIGIFTILLAIGRWKMFWVMFQSLDMKLSNYLCGKAQII